MKKKGFTLIELLAVIVILAVVALISMPLVLNTIDKAKKGAAEESANSYVSAIETAIVSDMMNSNYNYNPEQTFILSDNGKKIVNGEKELEINIKGTYPTSGSVVIKDAIVKSAELKVSGYDINYKAELPTYTKYSNGTAIYYNPETNTKCSLSEAVSKTGVKSGCMKWYTFNDDETSSTVNMILDHNTTALVAYNSDNTNSEMKEVKVTLESDTESWNKSINPRLITADEVAKITGNTSFNGVTSDGDKWFCLDTNTPDTETYCSKAQGTSQYAWLFDYTNNATSHGANIKDASTYGYWTSTPVTGSSTSIWSGNSDGNLALRSAYNADVYGVRPVITVEKVIINI